MTTCEAAVFRGFEYHVLGIGARVPLSCYSKHQWGAGGHLSVRLGVGSAGGGGPRLWALTAVLHVTRSLAQHQTTLSTIVSGPRAP